MARALPDSTTAFGLALVAACVVLIYFDHRRSRQRGGRLLLGGLLGLLGAAAWIEAAARMGAVGLLVSASGWIALIGIAGLWWVADRTRRARA
jgi:hypothetical protein